MKKKKEIPYMWNLKRIDTNEFITKLKQTQSLENKFLVAGVAGGGRGKIRGRDSYGVWDGQVHTVIFKMDNQKGPVYSTGNSAQFYGAAWMGGEFGRE